MTSIQNRILDLSGYKKKSPSPNIGGTFEIHIFMTPLNPNHEIVQKYIQVTEQINKERGSIDPNCTLIKPCLLALDFRGKGYVHVMQSSRYCNYSNLDEAISECNKEADLYHKKFQEQDVPITIIREKLEALASSSGVPVTDEEAKIYPKYFEFHIRLKRKNNDTISPVTQEELTELTKISDRFTRVFNTPVPISYNKINEHQRYLNIRFRNVGSQTSRLRVSEIVDEINKAEYFEWVKTISEYVPYDSFTELDRGWIDF